MEISIYYNNLESSDAIKNYVENKIGKVKKYLEEPITAQVALSIEKLNNFVKVNLNAHGYIIHVEEKDANLYSAIDLVSDTLERKIKKYLERLKKNKNHKTKALDKIFTAKEEIFAMGEEGKSEKQIIKVKNYDVKIMDTEEAAMQMDLLNRDFFVFINNASDAVNVIYKRKDGNYGLIEAKAR